MKKKKVNEKKGTESKDLYLRVSADFQNYKRRVEQEKIEWIKVAQRNVITPLLSILDDIDRAIEAAKENEGIRVGLELSQKNILKIFEDLGVKEIDCSGMFDPELHEAMVQVDLKEHESGQIVDVLNKGYSLDSHVLRHAKVSVAK